MAAGQGLRFGRNKLVEPFRGEPLIRFVVRAALESHLARVIVVLGSEAALVRDALEPLVADERLFLIVNPAFREGQSASVKAGLGSVPADCAGAMFLVGDQPLLDSAAIDQLIAAFEDAEDGICLPFCDGQSRNPVIFSRRFFAALRDIRGDQGGRGVIAANREAVSWVLFKDAAIFADIDTIEDYRHIQSLPQAGSSVVAALGLEQARVIAICGAGGKSSLMMALVREFSAQGGRILATTTTKLASDEQNGPWTAFAADDAEAIMARTTAPSGAWLAYRRHDETEARLIGFAPEMVDQLCAKGGFSRIIVEADGARCLPLKAPGEREPVFPASVDTVIAVAGLSGLGRPLDEETVFRPERWSALSSLPLSGTITPRSLAQVVVADQGMMRGSPDQARRLVFLNQADVADGRALGGAVLDEIAALSGNVVDRAVVAALRPVTVVHEVRDFAIS